MCVGALLTEYYDSVWSAPAHVFLLWPLCSRFQRGLENLTHEATHYNFCRNSSKWNDRLANWLCAYWVLLSVDMFRKSHRIHHGLFGSEVDPDKVRFAELNIDHIPRSRRQVFGYLLHVLPIYIFGYWKQFSNKRGQFLKSVILHVLLASLISYVWYRNFWVLWLVYFWVPFVFYLPVHRFLAEAEEHRYQNSETEFEATFSNLGRFQRWFFHPHGDAYHLLHHLLPQIPHWKIAWTHRRLLALDTAYNDGQYRTTLLESPKTLLRCSPDQPVQKERILDASTL